MAVSGAHVAFLIFPLLFGFRFLGMKRAHAHLLVIVFLCAFVFVAGFSPSIMRAVIMASILLFASVLKRSPDFFSAISVSALILILMHPYHLFQVGFLLSYGATLSIAMFYPAIKKRIRFYKMPNFIKDSLAVTLAAQVGILPIMAYFFNNLQTISLITNLLVFPIIGIVHVGGMLLAIIGNFGFFFTPFLATFLHLMLSFIRLTAQVFLNFEYALLPLKTPSVLWVGIYYLGCILLYTKPAFFKQNQKKLFLCTGSFVLCVLCVRLFFSPFEVVFLDVGQGDSVFVRTSSGKTLLIDGGGYTQRGKSDMGKSVVVPFLNHRGVRRIDWMVSSHSDADHLRGLLSVAEVLKVKNFMLPWGAEGYGFLDDWEKTKRISIHPSSRGDILYLDKNTTLQILNPQKDRVEKEQNNDVSLVIRLQYKNRSFLFCGDISTTVEQNLINENADLAADVLMLPHHGSLTSSSEVFLNEVDPALGIFSAGRNNRYGHPHPDVLLRVEQRDIITLRTDLHGAIRITSRGKALRYRTMLK
jgi:competence protein ComEC